MGPPLTVDVKLGTVTEGDLARVTAQTGMKAISVMD